jgi:hypothetical protein
MMMKQSVIRILSLAGALAAGGERRAVYAKISLRL